MGGSRSASRPKRQSKKSSVSYVESDDDDEEFLPSSRAAAAADNRRSNLRGTSHVEDLGIAKGRRTIIVKHPTRPQVFPCFLLCVEMRSKDRSLSLCKSRQKPSTRHFLSDALKCTLQSTLSFPTMQIGFLQAAHQTSILWLQTNSWVKQAVREKELQQ